MSDSETLSAKQEKAIQRLAGELHRLNNTVIEAVNLGISVELMRASRYHDDKGAWGDMLVPIIRPKAD